MKKTTKILTTIVLMLLVLSIIIVAVSATDSRAASATEATENVLLYSDVREVTSLRTENVKHFRLTDGTYQMVYYAEPIHRLDDEGVWQDIDNTLTAVRGASEYSTPDARTTFASKFSFNSDIFTVQEGGYSISMSMRGNELGLGKLESTTPVVKNPSQKRTSTSWSTIEEATQINNESSILYSEIFANTDLEYVLTNNTIKENIIIKSAQNNYSYSFTLKVNGLTANLDDSGRISLYDAKTSESKYVIPAPYMYDAVGNLSYNATYTLAEVKTGVYLLTVEADEAWINATDRVFPVTIDPTLIPSVGVYDTYVSSTTPNTVYGSASYMEVNSTSTALIKFNSYGFGIPDGVIINNAYVRIPCYHTSPSLSTTTAYVERPTEDWSDGYAYLPTSTFIRSASFTTPSSSSSSNPTTIGVPITSDVINWINNPRTNYGLAIKYQSGNQALRLLSYESGVSHATLSIEYTYDIQNGIYCFSNDFYTTRWLNVDSSTASAGSQITHKWVSFNHTLSINDRDMLFKISKTSSGTYIIRSMIDNTLALSTTSSTVVLKKISANDTAVPLADTFTIEWDGHGFLLYPYNTPTKCIRLEDASTLAPSFVAAPTSSPAAHWNLEEYTPSATDNGDYGVTVPETMLTGESLTITPNKWTTTIGANAPYVYATSTNANSITQTWSATTNTFTLDVHYPDDVTVYLCYNQNNTIISNEYDILVSTLFDDSDYYITNAGHNGYVQSDNNASPTVFASRLTGPVNQSWKVYHVIDGYYKILSATNANALTLTTSSQLTLQTYTGANNQLWQINKSYLKTYTITSKLSILNNSDVMTVLSSEADSSGKYAIIQSNTANDSCSRWYFMPFIEPTGSPLDYDYAFWSQPLVENHSNCYAYALNNPATTGSTQQPGSTSGNIVYASNYDDSSLDQYADELIEAVKSDYRAINNLEGTASVDSFFKEVSRDFVCPEGTYKVAFAVQYDGKGVDYHWYRQDSSGFWSDKQGTLALSNLDFNGSLIPNPEYTDDGYKFVGYFMVTPWQANVAENQNTTPEEQTSINTYSEIAILSYSKHEKEGVA